MECYSQIPNWVVSWNTTRCWGNHLCSIRIITRGCAARDNPNTTFVITSTTCGISWYYPIWYMGISQCSTFLEIGNKLACAVFSTKIRAVCYLLFWDIWQKSLAFLALAPTYGVHFFHAHFIHGKKEQKRKIPYIDASWLAVYILYTLLQSRFHVVMFEK